MASESQVLTSFERCFLSVVGYRNQVLVIVALRSRAVLYGRFLGSIVVTRLHTVVVTRLHSGD
jgi:hypothetical protein